MQREFCRGENASCIKYELHTFSAVHISGCILYVCTFFYTTERRHKMHTQASPAACCRHKVHILPGHRCSRQGKRKSAYTRRTPGAEQQPAKSAYTRQPRFVYKKYAYKAAADCEKVHTLGRHHKDNRSRQKVYTLGSPGFFTKSMHTRQPQIAKKCIH